MKKKYAQVRLLMVDDLSSDRQLIRYALEEIGFAGEIEFEHTGQAVLERYLSPNSLHPLPDLILLDWNLSDLPGEELLRRLKQHRATCTIPVVVMSSSQAEEAAAQCYSLGAGGYLSKPTDYDQLRDDIGATLAFWLQNAVKRNRNHHYARF